MADHGIPSTSNLIYLDGNGQPHLVCYADEFPFDCHILKGLFKESNKFSIYDNDISDLVSSVVSQMGQAMKGLNIRPQDPGKFFRNQLYTTDLTKHNVQKSWRPFQDALVLCETDKLTQRSSLMCKGIYLQRLLKLFLDNHQIQGAAYELHAANQCAKGDIGRFLHYKKLSTKCYQKSKSKYKLLPTMSVDRATETVTAAYTAACNSVVNPPRLLTKSRLPPVKCLPKSKNLKEKSRPVQSFLLWLARNVDQMLAAILLCLLITIERFNPLWRGHIHSTRDFIQAFKSLYESTDHTQSLHIRKTDIAEMYTNISRGDAKEAVYHCVTEVMDIMKAHTIQYEKRKATPSSSGNFCAKKPLVEFTSCPDATKTYMDAAAFMDILDTHLNSSYLTIGDIVAIQTEGLGMGSPPAGMLAIITVAFRRMRCMLASPPLPPHPTCVPAVAYADDTAEVTTNGKSWMADVFEKDLKEHGMSLECDPEVLIADGMVTQHMQFRISMMDNKLVFEYNPRNKGKWRYPVITDMNRRYLAIPILSGILFSHFDYSTRFDGGNILSLFGEVITLLKSKGYCAHEWQTALHLFGRKRKVSETVIEELYRMWRSL